MDHAPLLVQASDANNSPPQHQLRAMELQKITWILCDGCGKWRQVPQSLVDALDEDAEWCRSAANLKAFPTPMKPFVAYKRTVMIDIDDFA